ncbi:hypothetical protein [Rhodopila sp.]|uniref:hypothetical protein n=1 Tax=Rhodopila sp. TaxID=2480087 RepID=UPI003D125933
MTEGTTNEKQVAGDVEAKLNGLAARLDKFGAGLKAEYHSENYVGLLQRDLPEALKNNEQCKVRIFEDCGFRRSQPSIPAETSHLIRLKPAGYSDGSQPGIPTEASLGIPTEASLGGGMV